MRMLDELMPQSVTFVLLKIIKFSRMELFLRTWPKNVNKSKFFQSDVRTKWCGKSPASFKYWYTVLYSNFKSYI